MIIRKSVEEIETMSRAGTVVAQTLALGVVTCPLQQGADSFLGLAARDRSTFGGGH